MRHSIEKILSVLLCMAVMLTGIETVTTADEFDDTISAMEEQEAETQKTISNLEKETSETKAAISALQGERAQTEATVSNLTSHSSELQSTINTYSNELDDLSEEIAEAESQIAAASSEIVRLNGELEQVRAEKEARYELLKKRMRAAYESGGTEGMFLTVLRARSMGELLNRAEYMRAIVEYDKKVLADYQASEEKLREMTAEVEAHEDELNAYQDSLDEKHEQLADLTDTVRGQLSATNSNIASEKGKLADYDNQLAALDKKMKNLESQTAAAQAKLAQQIAERLAMKREDTSGSYSATGSELEWLAATIQAEADGESYTGKLAVGSVIMNRVKSSAFPNTIVGVITQNMQFASYRSGKVELIMSRGPNSTCVRAAQEVLDGARVGDYLFFMTQYFADYYGISEYTMIGHHAFFYRWVTKPKEDAEEAEEDRDEEGSGDEGTSEEGGSEEGSSEEESPEEGSSEEETPEEDSGGEEADPEEADE